MGLFNGASAVINGSCQNVWKSFSPVSVKLDRSLKMVSMKVTSTLFILWFSCSKGFYIIPGKTFMTLGKKRFWKARVSSWYFLMDAPVNLKFVDDSDSITMREFFCTQSSQRSNLDLSCLFKRCVAPLVPLTTSFLWLM